MDNRAENICRMYKEGASLRDIGRLLLISHETVRKILKTHGITKEDRLVNRSNRQAYLAVDVHKTWKTAIRTEADKRGISMSELTTEALR